MPRLIKRHRRSKAEIQEIRDAMFAVLERHRPMTVRQVFYQMVAAGHIPKMESQYSNTVGRLLVKMRREGVIPYNWIADNSRWMRKPLSFGSLREALQRTAFTYRQALWRDMPVYCEFWTEKDAIAGILGEITGQYDVPLMVARGFSSLAFLSSAGEAIREKGKPTFIYYFGDHDPSGLDIQRKIETELQGFAPGIPILFERVAVTPEQIMLLNLPTRPTKRDGGHSKEFRGESTDVDAIRPDLLRGLAQDCVERHIDARYLARMQDVENAERSTLDRLIAYGENAGFFAEN